MTTYERERKRKAGRERRKQEGEQRKNNLPSTGSFPKDL